MVSGDAVKPILKYFEIAYWQSQFSVSITPESLFAILALVFIIIWGFSLGRTKSIISLLAVYIAYAITIVFPFYERLEENARVSDYWLRVGVMMFGIVFVFFVLNMSFLRKRFSSSEYNLLGVFTITALQFGLLMAALSSFLPADIVQSYIGNLTPYITGPALFAWFIAPLVGLLFLNYFLRG